MLRRYATENKFHIYNEYIDDGISGTTFDRPAFKRMINDINRGHIGVVLGRLNALVLYYSAKIYPVTDIFFPERDVRLIILTDLIDTINDDNEMMPFLSVMNESYARDISRKVRSAYHAKIQNGEFLATYPPYGYKRSEESRKRLSVDQVAAEVVVRIFQMAARRHSSVEIARQLSKDGILIPTAYRGGAYPGRRFPEGSRNQTRWNASTIISILRNRVYLGCMLGHKFAKKSFKSKRVVSLPVEKWVEVSGTHEAIINQDTFDLAQKTIHVKNRSSGQATPNIFVGFVKCADCGFSMAFRANSGAHKNGSFTCNKYRKYSRTECSSHYISYEVLYASVLTDIQKHVKMIADGEKD
jgi:DNA invertase Pin-like site-specific DNA recombinase